MPMSVMRVACHLLLTVILALVVGAVCYALVTIVQGALSSMGF